MSFTASTRRAYRGAHPMTKVAVYVLLIAGGIAFMIPLLFTISTALKSPAEIASDPSSLIPKKPSFDNFVEAWRDLPFPRFVLNTLFITVTCTIAQVITGSLVAYGFARFQFRARNLLFYTMLATMMLPSQVTMIPVFMIWRSLHAIDTYYPLIVPSLFGGAAFNIFLLRQFFLTIPRELDEAAMLDGAGYVRIWWRILLPLSAPAVATVALFNFVGHWDDFLGPLIYLNTPEKYTVSVGLRLFQDTYSLDLERIMAASLIHIVPTAVLFFFTQRYFLKGINLSGLGGR